MFDRFTQRGREVFVAAQETAHRFHQPKIGTAHVLIGLIEVEGFAYTILARRGVTRDRAMSEWLNITPGGDARNMPLMIPFSDETQKVLDFTTKEAIGLGHTYIGTEHILLGLLRIQAVETDAQQLLSRLLGQDFATSLRTEVLRLLTGDEDTENTSLKSEVEIQSDRADRAETFLARAEETLKSRDEEIASLRHQVDHLTGVLDKVNAKLTEVCVQAEDAQIRTIAISAGASEIKPVSEGEAYSTMGT